MGELQIEFMWLIADSTMPPCFGHDGSAIRFFCRKKSREYELVAVTIFELVWSFV